MRTTKDCWHGHWFDVMHFPKRFPQLLKGTEVELIERFQNFKGDWVRVKTPSGEIYQLKESEVSD
jgi:hypothetical protein